MSRIWAFVFLSLCAWNNYAWNGLGHRLMAQIAYDQLSTQSRALFDKYNQSLAPYSPSFDFIAAAAWLDQIRRDEVHSFDNLHYVDIPFSKGSEPLPPIQKNNALSGIEQAVRVLSSRKTSDAEKGLSLRILIHLVGDVHQPLHTATRISKKFPNGDKGGNLFPLARNPFGRNLHQYWDNGGGYLLGRRSKAQLKEEAWKLEQKWSCNEANAQIQPEQWASESHEIAVKQAYKAREHQVPRKSYQRMVQRITQKQILFAGCRLGALLNRIGENR